MNYFFKPTQILILIFSLLLSFPQKEINAAYSFNFVSHHRTSSIQDHADNPVAILDTLIRLFEAGEYNSVDPVVDSLIIHSSSPGCDNKLHNDSCYVELLILSGAAKMRMGDLERGKKRIDQAFEKTQSAFFPGKGILASKIYRNYGNYYFYRGEMDSAFTNYQKALSYLDDSDHQSLKNRASCLQNIGIIYNEKGIIEKAEHYFIRALKLKKELYGENDPIFAKANLNMGTFLVENQKINQAISFINRADQIFINEYGYDNLLMADLYLQRGKISYIKWDFEKALIYFLKSLSLYLENLNNTSIPLLTNYFNIGICYQKINDHQLALKYYHKSIKHYFPEITKAYRNLAGLHSILHNPDSASYYFSLALENARKIKDPNDLALSYNHYGKFLARQGMKTQGLDFLKKSLEIAQNLYQDDNPALVYYLYDIADFYFENGNYDSTIRTLQRCIDILERDEAGNNRDQGIQYTHEGQRKPMCKGLMALACFELYKCNNDLAFLEKSFHLSRETTEQLDKDLLRYTKESSFLLSRELVQKYYHDFIRISRELYLATGKNNIYLTDIFKGIERSKAAYFRNKLQTKQAYYSGQVPDSLISELNNIRLLIVEFESLLGSYDTNQINQPFVEEEIIDTLFSLNKRKEDIYLHLNDKYRIFNQLRYQTQVSDPSDIRKKLKKDEVILNYSIDKTELEIVLLDKDTMMIHHGQTDTISSLIRDYLRLFSFKKIAFDDTLINEEFLRRSNHLYFTLIHPFSDQIAGKRLIIIPDQELAYLPFETIVTEYRYSEEGKLMVHYLVQDHAITYTPSATLFFGYFRNTDSLEVPPEVLAIAPDYSSYWEEPNKRTERGLAFKALPGARSEVNKIADYFQLTKHVNDEATEYNFKQAAYGFDILHFAMHALVDNENPLFSKLVFQKSDTYKDDGFLNIYEIYSLDLNSDLAVLSSCNTGYGQLRRGEGVVNLSRAFQFAGIPSTIATLWDVDDASSAKIMKNFYKHLADGLEKDKALRLAKLEFLDQAKEMYIHPWFWAGYVLIGENAAISRPVANFSYINILNILLTILTLVLTVLSIYVIRNRIVNRASPD